MTNVTCDINILLFLIYYLFIYHHSISLSLCPPPHSFFVYVVIKICKKILMERFIDRYRMALLCCMFMVVLFLPLSPPLTQSLSCSLSLRTHTHTHTHTVCCRALQRLMRARLERRTKRRQRARKEREAQSARARAQLDLFIERVENEFAHVRQIEPSRVGAA